jgi:hypothetical protein
MSELENKEPTELETLRERAKAMNITFHPSIGVDNLKAKIKDAMEGNKPDPDADEKEPVPVAAESQKEMHSRLRKEAGRLVRINVTCMNPAMKEHQGAIYTVSNSVVGTFKKYVPFNTEDGWHVPNIIYQHMLERKCQVFHTVKDSRGNAIKKGKLIKELSIDLLKPLDEKEIKDLAQKQALSRAID